MINLTWLYWSQTFFQRKVAKTLRRNVIYFFLAPLNLCAFALIFSFKPQEFYGRKVGRSVAQAGGQP
jgi:hypothetical protein